MNNQCTSLDQELHANPDRMGSWIAPTWPVTTIAKSLKHYLDAVHRRRESRDAFKHLLSLDDALLRDVGVSRADVEWAAQLPLKVNAARALNDCAIAHKKLKDLY